MLPRNDPDRIQVTFDDHRLVANAGLLLPVTLAQHLGPRELVDDYVDLGNAPGRANPGDKMLTLVASALAGGDSYCLKSNVTELWARKVSWRTQPRNWKLASAVGKTRRSSGLRLIDTRRASPNSRYVNQDGRQLGRDGVTGRSRTTSSG